MLSSVVASRSVSSDNANLFFAAQRPENKGQSFNAHFTLSFIVCTYLEAVTAATAAAAAAGKKLAEPHKVFEQWLARLTKTRLRLQRGKLLKKIYRQGIMTSFLCEVHSVHCLFLQALRVVVCKREKAKEREEEEEEGLRRVCVCICCSVRRRKTTL